MFHKDHFYNSLVYLAIFAILILGYFDKYYIKFLLANLLISIILDFLWVLLQATPFWNPNPPTHHSTIQTPFLRFMYLFVIFLMIAKVYIHLDRYCYCYCSSDTEIMMRMWGSQFLSSEIRSISTAELSRTIPFQDFCPDRALWQAAITNDLRANWILILEYTYNKKAVANTTLII